MEDPDSGQDFTADMVLSRKGQDTDVFRNDGSDANLQDENSYYLDRTKRLKPNSVDLDYLDEQARKKLGLIDKNEIVIILGK